MSAIHDLGGMRGFGRVVIDPAEPVFEAAWEAQVFGLEMAIVSAGLVTRVDELRSHLESCPPDVYLSTSYYGLWARALESVLVARGVLTPDEIDASVLVEGAGVTFAATETADALAERALIGRPSAHDVDRPPLYAPGDDVVTRNVHPRGHTRLAGYVRGRRGVIERRYAGYPFPESAAQGVIEPEYVYAVRFEAAELWGDSAEPNVSVCIDLFEPYLVSA